MGELEARRRRVRSMLNLSAPADALYAYYALYHDPTRTQLAIHEDSRGRIDGFVAVCQTGQRLFEPTVVLRTPDAIAARELLHGALVGGRPYYLIATLDLRDPVMAALEVTSADVNQVFRIDLSRFAPAVNVMVAPEKGPGGSPHFVIRSQGQVAASAGTNWISPYFAELFVQTDPVVQRRGWGKAVAEACTTWVLRTGRQPLYIASERNHASVALAESIGFVDTGAREFAAEGVCCLP
ncbi:MAG: GNAT family N-acetyltransferase [Chloroflexi bacterium]|nr:GNAT family N-acetyltransferase [Chloroflexota bacterium]